MFKQVAHVSDSEPERVAAPSKPKSRKSEFSSAKDVLKAQKRKEEQVKPVVKKPTVIEIPDSPDLKHSQLSSDDANSDAEIQILDSSTTKFKDVVAQFACASTSKIPINYFAAPASPKVAPSKPVVKIDRSSVPSDSIPSEFLSVASECPVCKKEQWNEKKTVQAKRKHVEACAKKHEWELSTVNVVLKKKVRELQEAEAEKRRQADLEQTLFDGIVAGNAHGLRVNKALDLRIVGHDEEGAVAATQGGSLHQATLTQVQKELEHAKKKAKKVKAAPSKATKLGKAISILDKDTAVQGSSTYFPAKKVYGHLKTYDETIDRLAQKAEEMIAAVPVVESSPARPKVISIDTESSFEIPATQPIKPSKVAERLAVTESSKMAAAKARVSGGSMWALASGTDLPGVSRPISADFSSSKRGLATKTTTAKPRSAAPSESASPDSNADDRPDYSTWTLPAMQTESSKFGYKPPTTKSACVKLLNKIWDLTHPVEGSASESESSASSSSASSSAVRSKGKGKAKAKVKKPRVSAASMASAGEFLDESDDEELGLEAAPEGAGCEFTKRMHQAVLGNQELYGKILLYQPVAFEDIVALAKEHAIKASALTIRKFLDTQSITFYQAEQMAKRNGTRTKKSKPKRKAVK